MEGTLGTLSRQETWKGMEIGGLTIRFLEPVKSLLLAGISHVLTPAMAVKQSQYSLMDQRLSTRSISNCRHHPSPGPFPTLRRVYSILQFY